MSKLQDTKRGNEIQPCNRKDICYHYPNHCDLCRATSDIVNNYPCFQDRDLVEVVRCKDCKYWTPMDNGISWHHQGRTDGECEMLWKIHDAERHLTKQEHFCSYGERKE
jgi:hypothetical protein